MLLVILGADASYDFSQVEVGTQFLLRPPVSNELVDINPTTKRFLNTVPDNAASAMLMHARREMVDGTSLEQVLDREEGADPGLTRGLVAFRYYIQAYMAACSETVKEQYAGTTNHVELVERIRRARPEEKVLYVTFNYDTILEASLHASYQWTSSTLRSYISCPRFSLLKLHGSYTWGRATSAITGSAWTPSHVESYIDKAQRAALKAADAGTLAVSEEVLSLSDRLRNGRDWAISHPRSNEANVIVPAIALPMATKAKFTCPTEHQDHLSEMLPHVDRILTIGWKGAEEHFLQLLKAIPRPVRIEVVSRTPKTRREVFDALDQNLTFNATWSGDSGATTYEAPFSSFLRTDRLQRFLEA